jgi:chaperonin cofactor prefoldin
LRLHVSDAYVKKSEVETLEAQMEKRFDRLEQMIARLYDKIDAKADK